MYDIYGGLDNVSIITMAPEKENALNVIRELSESNITVSLGHSQANFTEGEAAVEHGSNLITHLFNAMLPVSWNSIARSIGIIFMFLVFSSTIATQVWLAC